MKRLLVCFFILGGILLAKAQDATITALNYATLEKKFEKSNLAIEDEKDKIKPKTWSDRGEMFQDIAEVNTQFLRLGMSSAEAKLYMKEPLEVKTEESGGIVRQTYVYERINLIFENDVLSSWKETKVIHPDPLPMALEAYKKALELDVKGGNFNKSILENIERLKKQLENSAILAFTTGDYAKALACFQCILDCSTTEVYDNFIDTVIIYNAGLAARNAGDHYKAVEYFKRAIEIGYGGSDTYYLLKNEYMAIGDSVAALQTLDKGFEIYPDTFLLLIEIVNFHLSAGHSEEALKYLELARSKEPNNPSIYFAQVTLYEKLGNRELALKAYNDALRVDPEYFNAYFNIGALYFNNAVELYEKANEKVDAKEYNAAREIADIELRKALAPMEKAHSLEPKDLSCLETLKTVYYRLQMDKEYQEVLAKIKALQQ